MGAASIACRLPNSSMGARSNVQTFEASKTAKAMREPSRESLAGIIPGTNPYPVRRAGCPAKSPFFLHFALALGRRARELVDHAGTVAHVRFVRSLNQGI